MISRMQGHTCHMCALEASRLSHAVIVTVRQVALFANARGRLAADIAQTLCEEARLPLSQLSALRVKLRSHSSQRQRGGTSIRT